MAALNGVNSISVNEDSAFAIRKNGNTIAYIIGDEELAYAAMEGIKYKHNYLNDVDNYDGLFCWTIKDDLPIQVDPDTGAIILFDEDEDEKRWLKS